MGWINHTGNTLPDDSHASAVVVSKNSSSTILFAMSGNATVTQRETMTITEYRGLNKTSALEKVGSSDNTTRTTYYAEIDGVVHSFVAVTGTGKNSEISASRANNADGWTVTKREISYEVVGLDSNVWHTTLMSSSGRVETVSVDKSISHVGSAGNLSRLYATKTVTVKEYRLLTQSAATTLATNSATDSVTNTTVYFQQYVDLSSQQTGNFQWVNAGWWIVKTGTEKTASARYVSEGEGWTVTVTETEYGYATSPSSGGNWRWAT